MDMNTALSDTRDAISTGTKRLAEYLSELDGLKIHYQDAVRRVAFMEERMKVLPALIEQEKKLLDIRKERVKTFEQMRRKENTQEALKQKITKLKRQLDAMKPN